MSALPSLMRTLTFSMLCALPLAVNAAGHKHHDDEHHDHAHDHGHEHKKKHDDHKHDKHEHKEHKHEKHDHHDHDDNLAAHVHGVASLTLAIEGTELEIAFESPSESMVGFEYVAKTEAEKKAVNDAKAKLQAAADLFTFEGAECALEKAEVDVSALLGKDKHHDHGDDHGHKHGHDKHDKHDKRVKSVHSEVSAEYHFECDTTAKLDHIELGFFEAFERLEVINAQWVGESKQGSASVRKSDAHIEL